MIVRDNYAKSAGKHTLWRLIWTCLDEANQMRGLKMFLRRSKKESHSYH